METDFIEKLFEPASKFFFLKSFEYLKYVNTSAGKGLNLPKIKISAFLDDHLKIFFNGFLKSLKYYERLT